MRPILLTFCTNSTLESTHRNQLGTTLLKSVFDSKYILIMGLNLNNSLLIVENLNSGVYKVCRMSMAMKALYPVAQTCWIKGKESALMDSRMI